MKRNRKSISLKLKTFGHDIEQILKRFYKKAVSNKNFLKFFYSNLGRNLLAKLSKLLN